MVLYSTKVTYDNGTQRDLRLVSTDGFASDPMELVADPTAALARSSLTEDGQFVLYLTDQTPTGGTLHVVGMDGVARCSRSPACSTRSRPRAAASSSATTPATRTSTRTSPILQNTSIPRRGKKPLLIEAKVTDAKNFQIDAPAGKVVYTRSGVDRDASDPEHDGLFWCDLP